MGRNYTPGGNPNPSPATRFKPGNQASVGHGRPKTRRLTERYNRLLDRKKAELRAIVRSRTATMEEILAAETILRGCKETRAVIEVTDRVQGKEPQAHELGGTEGEKLVDEGKVADRIVALMTKAKGKR
jgi:hypothetical protein